LKKLHHHRARRDEVELDVSGSSAIAAAYYQPGKGGGVLTVEFVKSKGVYQFDNVSKGTAKRIETEGAGETINNEILD
jgi:hypothetical protein